MKQEANTQPSIRKFTQIIEKPGTQRRSGPTNGEGTLPLPLVAPKSICNLATLASVFERESIDREGEGSNITNINQRGKVKEDKPDLGQGQVDQDRPETILVSSMTSTVCNHLQS